MPNKTSDDELVNTDILENASHSTRNAILSILKRKGEVSVKELSAELGISKMAVSKHLSVLERDRVVRRTAVRSGIGRPEYRYMLTPSSQYLFPTSYPYIALSALNFIRENMGNGGVEAFFARRRNELIEKYSRRLAGLGLEERVRELARLREEDGFLAEVEEGPDFLCITEHNCPMLSVACKFNAACSSEAELFSMLLDATVERTHWMVNGQHMCRYTIRPKNQKTELPLY